MDPKNNTNTSRTSRSSQNNASETAHPGHPAHPVESCQLDLTYQTPEEAHAVARSLDVDNYDFIMLRVVDNTLQCKVLGGKITSVLHTLDDFLACLSVTDGVLRGVEGLQELQEMRGVSLSDGEKARDEEQ